MVVLTKDQNIKNMQSEEEEWDKREKKGQVSWHCSPGWPLYSPTAPPLKVSEGGCW